MNISRKFLTVALSGLFVLSSAQAATDWGVHDPLEVAAVAVAPGSFSEVFQFSLTTESALTLVASSIEMNSFLSVSAGSVQLYKETLAGDTFVSGYAFGTPAYTVTPLVAGDYFYRVSGTATGSFGGLFSLASTATAVSVVPEPKPFLLMLSGLGLIGMAARSRMR